MFLGVFTIMLALGTINPQGAQAQAQSNDATLKSLTLIGTDTRATGDDDDEDDIAITLSPTFAPGMNVYTAEMRGSYRYSQAGSDEESRRR